MDVRIKFDILTLNSGGAEPFKVRLALITFLHASTVVDTSTRFGIESFVDIRSKVSR
jgi:hypothetical protein